jgi:hypothetical protein
MFHTVTWLAILAAFVALALCVKFILRMYIDRFRQRARDRAIANHLTLRALANTWSAESLRDRPDEKIVVHHGPGPASIR